MKSVILTITITLTLLGVTSASFALSSGERPPLSFIPEDIHVPKEARTNGFTQTIVPGEVIVSIKPAPEGLENINLDNSPPRKKKTKKPSNLKRLRQLYFLPLLHPISGGRR
ncbi:hypothetical protein [Parendozoicomonas sp. Alg238-R29]|uniref:hypothetical protein n=1 Tax=Parendozoicomonas sp. Alg238-R29 TaxID=2993446 RepID=UPI00248E77FC|nr:hypothetical protein [Parendozoicomonas sp. Alg238-R29]